MADTVKFWFDPSCPWAWMTSRWVDEVSSLRGFDVEWKVMSLAVLNEDQDVSEEYRAFFPRALRYTRLTQAAQELHGQKTVKALYDALGARIHLGGSTDPDEVIPAALAEVGLPASFTQNQILTFRSGDTATTQQILLGFSIEVDRLLA